MLICVVVTQMYTIAKKIIKMYISIYIHHFVDFMFQLKNRGKMQNAEFIGSGITHDTYIK